MNEHLSSSHAGSETRRDGDHGCLDAASFGAAFEEVRPMLRVVAAGECGFDLADDIVQQAAIVAFERIDQFAVGTNFKAWTATITRGVARNQRRSEQRHQSRIGRWFQKRESGSEYSMPGDGEAFDGANAVGVGLELSDSFDDGLKKALGSLSVMQRSCLLLRTVLDHSYDEIGAILEIPAATARSHVFRARQAMLDRMSDSDDSPTSTDQRSSDTRSVS